MPITINGSGTVTGISAGGLPDAIITQAEIGTNVAGTGPAFSAYQSSAQTLSSNTSTKILFQTEEFDTNNNFSSSTFTPTVAGYYQFTGGISIATVQTPISIIFYKNGSQFKYVAQIGTSGSGFGSALIYLNGATDYVELYGVVTTGQALLALSSFTYFQASMVRSA